MNEPFETKGFPWLPTVTPTLRRVPQSSVDDMWKTFWEKIPKFFI
ncbi:unnamed protein product [Spirodela intermedia]|uniref:Uncharacterized protein n=1 Tax=Spirodela intermedia TaxID=51605 RepID=A0A7I8IUT9_SPIIN|nr:unnamed protein product [Spirodela intermedia]CAA6661519.1 unnamed protein product [Spirodela intermedia]